MLRRYNIGGGTTFDDTVLGCYNIWGGTVLRKYNIGVKQHLINTGVTYCGSDTVCGGHSIGGISVVYIISYSHAIFHYWIGSSDCVLIYIRLPVEGNISTLIVTVIIIT